MTRGVYLAVHPAMMRSVVFRVAYMQLVVVHDDEVHYHEASGKGANGQCEGTDALCGRCGIELGVLEGRTQQQAWERQAANQHAPHWNLLHLADAMPQPKRRLVHRACLRLRAARCTLLGQGWVFAARVEAPSTFTGVVRNRSCHARHVVWYPGLTSGTNRYMPEPSLRTYLVRLLGVPVNPVRVERGLVCVPRPLPIRAHHCLWVYARMLNEVDVCRC